MMDTDAERAVVEAQFPFLGESLYDNDLDYLQEYMGTNYNTRQI